MTDPTRFGGSILRTGGQQTGFPAGPGAAPTDLRIALVLRPEGRMSALPSWSDPQKPDGCVPGGILADGESDLIACKLRFPKAPPITGA
ncbi:MAG: hypothetical protein NVSMB25_11730 [Thermoleophilaceae bacterium]